MRQMVARGMKQNEALLTNSKAFNDAMMERCMAAMLERDRRLMQLADKGGASALRAFRALGALEPAWLSWEGGREKAAINELGHSLEISRPMREYALRSRVVRVETAESYSTTRLRLRDLALPAVEHVLSASDVAKLRCGTTLVLDPSPALLPPEALAAAHADLMRLVRGSGAVVRSENPCNSGSFHGMLPLEPSQAQAMGLHDHTRALIRKFAALPAIVERHGWPRKLVAPAMLQLGYYPGGSGARYRPHLDRWASEVSNRRELTFLVYINVGWDATAVGGHLRLHPEDGSGQPPVDVAPTAGRIVIFESGRQMHEVCESSKGADRLALTLWVEYEGEWEGDPPASIGHSPLSG